MTDMTTKAKRPPSRPQKKQEVQISEREKVENWNREQIIKLFAARGFVMPEKQVEELVKAGRSDWDLKKLLDQGCSPELAYKILT